MDIVKPSEPVPVVEEVIQKRVGGDLSGKDDADVLMRFSEKKRLDWKEKSCECVLFMKGGVELMQTSSQTLHH